MVQFGCNLAVTYCVASVSVRVYALCRSSLCMSGTPSTVTTIHYVTKRHHKRLAFWPSYMLRAGYMLHCMVHVGSYDITMLQCCIMNRTAGHPPCQLCVICHAACCMLQVVYIALSRWVAYQAA